MTNLSVLNNLLLTFYVIELPFILTVSQLTGNVLRSLLTYSRGSLNVINKHSSSNVNITFVQSYLVFNNVLKWLD